MNIYSLVMNSSSEQLEVINLQTHTHTHLTDAVSLAGKILSKYIVLGYFSLVLYFCMHTL